MEFYRNEWSAIHFARSLVWEIRRNKDSSMMFTARYYYYTFICDYTLIKASKFRTMLERNVFRLRFLKKIIYSLNFSSKYFRMYISNTWGTRT